MRGPFAPISRWARRIAIEERGCTNCRLPHIAAPVERVWDVLVNRQEEWWCPKPWYAKIVEQDRRPGGRCAMVMYGPDGEEMPQEGVFLAWDEGRRFVSTDAVTADFQPAGPFMIGIWEVAPRAMARAIPLRRGTGPRKRCASMRRWASRRAGTLAPISCRHCAKALEALTAARRLRILSREGEDHDRLC
jgi:uncharacterized protein YndB with AHSA1/START domain